jgi:uncharacterized protein YrrD
MQIELDAKVVSKDGEQIGKVDRIVIDPASLEVIEIVTHKGLFSVEDRIIARDFIESGDDDTVQLNIDAAKVQELPLFASADYLVPEESWDQVMYPKEGEEYGYTTTASSSWMGATTVMAASSPGGGQYSQVQGYSLGASQLADTSLEVRTNLPEDAVVLRHRADVLSADGKKLGVVDDVALDQDGKLTGLHVRSGVLRHHETYAPANLVKSLTNHAVTLTLDASAARKALVAPPSS